MYVWRSALHSAHAVSFRDAVFAAHHRVQMRRGLSLWKRFVLLREAEQSFAIEQKFDSHASRVAPGSPMQRWRRASACTEHDARDRRTRELLRELEQCRTDMRAASRACVADLDAARRAMRSTQ